MLAVPEFSYNMPSYVFCFVFILPNLPGIQIVFQTVLREEAPNQLPGSQQIQEPKASHSDPTVKTGLEWRGSERHLIGWSSHFQNLPLYLKQLMQEYSNNQIYIIFSFQNHHIFIHILFFHATVCSRLWIIFSFTYQCSSQRTFLNFDKIQ